MADSRSGDGVAVPWLAGLVLAGIGAGLAVVALTFPWISVRTDAQYTPFTLAVTSIERQGPTFAVLLVLAAVGAVVAFAAARRRTGIRWALVVVCAPLPALAALFVGLRANAADLGSVLPSSGVDPEQASPDVLVSPAQGLVFYTAGLLLVGLGVAIAGLPASARIPIAVPPSPAPARRPPVVRLTALVLAVPLVVLSQALAWFDIDTTDGRLPAVITGWPGIYRAGLIAILVLLLGTALTTGWRRDTLRTAALYVCGGLYGVLLINAWLLWDPTGVANHISAQRDELGLGLGYFASLAAVPLLAVVVGPRLTEEPETASDPEPAGEPRPEVAEPVAEPRLASGPAPEIAADPEPVAEPRPELAEPVAAADPEPASEPRPEVAEPQPRPEPATDPSPQPPPAPAAASGVDVNQKGAEA